MGNFSIDPNVALDTALGRGYTGVRIERGVNPLDRDLNLLSELPTAITRSVLARYIGNGVRFGDSGFRIEGVGLTNDFQINAGTLLVQGIEVNTVQMRYTAQSGVPALAPGSDVRADLVYLDVSFIEVTGATDPDLQNKKDVHIETSVRQKVVSVVRVAPDADAQPPVVQPGHVHVPLARLVRPAGMAEIRAEQIVKDLRQQISVSALVSRIETLERIHAPTLDPQRREFSPKAMSAAAGGALTVFGRNYDLGATNLRVTLFSDATLLRFDLPIGQRTSAQAVATVPVNVIPPGQYLVLVANEFGIATSRERLSITA